jgi:hypothetical protein
VLSSLKQKVPYTFYIMPPKTAKVTAAGTGRNKIPDKLTDSEKKKVRWLDVFSILLVQQSAISKLPLFILARVLIRAKNMHVPRSILSGFSLSF